jgi:hypothetical protein
MSNTAVLYDHETVDQTPLIRKAVSINFGRFKRSSLLLGLLVGFFIQFSTLGANYLVISIFGDDVLTSSRSDILLFSFVWSFFTSALAILLLSFLRNIVTSSYATGDHEEDEIDDMVLHMECRFVVGALVGVCMAWSATDIVLGMSGQIVYSLGTLAVALAWCKVMMWCFSPREIHDDEETVMIV